MNSPSTFSIKKANTWGSLATGSPKSFIRESIESSCRNSVIRVERFFAVLDLSRLMLSKLAPIATACGIKILLENL